jgi:hypothetical protein
MCCAKYEYAVAMECDGFWTGVLINWVEQSHKSPGIDQIPAELIKEGGRIIRSEIHKLIFSIWNF